MAIYCNHIEMIKFQINSGNIDSSQKEKILMYAIRNHDLKLIKMILEVKAWYNNSECFHEAILSQYLDIIELLIPDLRYPQRQLLDHHLVAAFNSGNLEIIKLIVTNLHFNTFFTNDDYPLRKAIIEGYCNIIPIILPQIMNPNQIQATTDYSVTYDEYGFHKVLKSPIDINYLYRSKILSPICLAVICGNVKIVSSLLEDERIRAYLLRNFEQIVIYANSEVFKLLLLIKSKYDS